MNWQIKYLVADTGHLLTSRRVLISSAVITKVEWDGRDIVLAMTRDEIKTAPLYYPESIGATFESDLTVYYKGLIERLRQRLSLHHSKASDGAHSGMALAAARPIGEIMSQETALISPDATVREACKKMRDRDIGFLPVGINQQVVGAITDRDVAMRTIAAGLDPRTCKVRDVMSQNIACIYADEDIHAAAQLMEQRKIRRLVVLDRQERLVGVVSLSDLSTHARDLELAGKYWDCSNPKELVS